MLQCHNHRLFVTASRVACRFVAWVCCLAIQLELGLQQQKDVGHPEGTRQPVWAGESAS